MSRTVLVSSYDDLADRVGYASEGNLVRVASDPFPRDAAAFLKLVDGMVPDIVVLHDDGDIDGTLKLVSELDKEFDVSVILVTDTGNEIALAAVRAGAVDVVGPEATVQELRQAVERAESQSQGRQALKAVRRPAGGPGAGQSTGRVVTVASPKGGVGKTTIASNLALGIAQREPNAVVLVDLDIHFGDVAHAFALTPEYTVVDAARAAAAGDVLGVKSLLTAYKNSLYVISGSESPVAADALTAAEIGQLIRLLANQFKYVVVDTAPGLSEHTLAVLDRTTELVLVTSLDVPGVRGLRKELDTLRELGMLADARHVVLNFNHESRGMSVRDVEATIREDVDIVVPVDTMVPQSVNRGAPLIGDNGRDPVTRQLVRLVERIVPPKQDAGQRKGRLGGLFGKEGSAS